jgi:hypothetical protein
LERAKNKRFDAKRDEHRFIFMGTNALKAARKRVSRAHCARPVYRDDCGGSLANRKVCHSIDHATVNAVVPLKFCLRKKIVEAGQSIVNTALRGETDGP